MCETLSPRETPRVPDEKWGEIEGEVEFFFSRALTPGLWASLKVHCYALSVLCQFFAVENGGEENRGRGAGQREAGLCRTFFALHLFQASRSIDIGVSVSWPCKVIRLSDEVGLWDMIKRMKTKRQVCPEQWWKIPGIQHRLAELHQSILTCVGPTIVRGSQSFRCSCVYFATQYNVHYDNRQAGHLLSALRLKRYTAAIIFPHNKLAQNMLRRIAGQGELFSSDFRACTQSPRWATLCSFGSVSSSYDAAPRSAVCKRAFPIACSPLSEQRRTRLIFAEQINVFQVKAWQAAFKAWNANLKLLDDRRKRKKNCSTDLRRVVMSSSVDRSSISSASVAASLFPNLSCLVCCCLLTEAFHYSRSLPFFQLSSAEPNVSLGCWRPHETPCWLRINRPSAELEVDSFQLYFGHW